MDVGASVFEIEWSAHESRTTPILDVLDFRLCIVLLDLIIFILFTIVFLAIALPEWLV
jgi:hypothetical protein